MAVFKASSQARCRPADVIESLRNGGEASGLLPLPIEVETIRGGGLRRGTQALLVAQLAGHSLSFELVVRAASPRGLRMEAIGPFEVELIATFRAIDRALTEIAGQIRTGGRPRSIPDRLFKHAGEGVLAGGAFELAAHQLAARAEAHAARGGGSRRLRT